MRGGVLGGEDVLLASAPCYVGGDEHVGGICDSALFNLADKPFGTVGAEDAAWTDIEGGGFSTFEITQAESSLTFHAGTSVHRFDAVPAVPAFLSIPNRQDESAVFETDGFWLPTPCVDVDGDGATEVCRWSEDFRVLPGPLTEATEAGTPFLQTSNGYRGPVAFLDIAGDWLVAFGQPEAVDGTSGVKLAWLEDGEVDLDQTPTQLGAQGLIGAGAQIAGADLDGDGADELVLTSPWSIDGRGEVTVYRISSPDQVEPIVSFVGSNPNGLLGRSLDVGDVNGDGELDLVAGAPADRSVYVWLGPLEGIDDDSRRWVLRPPSSEADDFGWSVATATFDGHGVAIGAPADSRRTTAGGAVYWCAADMFR